MRLTHDEILDEYKYDWTMCLDIDQEEIFFKEYPKDKILEDYYFDHAKKYGIVSSMFLETGLKRMESWMIREIMRGDEKSEFDFNQMNKMIRLNRHLHPIIKTNLLDNLEASWKKDEQEKTNKGKF